MSFANTIAAELRLAVRDLDRLTLTHRDPEKYHILKSEIRNRLDQSALMLEGNFDIVMPEPKPAGGARRPTVIKDARGNVIQVDFKARRALKSPADRSR